jgi:hypothetical protein
VPPQPITSRGMFDEEHNVLPVITVFDAAVADASAAASEASAAPAAAGE